MSRRTAPPYRLAGIALLSSALLCLPARAVRSAGFADELREAGWTWHAMQRLELPGAQLRVQRFSAPLGPVQVAQRLDSLPSGRLHRLQLAGPGLLLSGLVRGTHWLVQLVPDGPGTAGLLSSLDPAASQDKRFEAWRFAPPDARRIFDLHVEADHATLTRLDCTGPLASVFAQVSALLSSGQWRPSTAVPSEAPVALHEWHHPGGASLTTLFEVRGDRVAVTFWHRSKEAP